MLKKWIAALLVCALMPALQGFHVNPGYTRERTALAVVHPDGRVSISPAGEEPRAALSLAKLYLGYWVLYNGTKEEKAQVEEMVRVSNDAIAEALDARYPQAIDEIAADFELERTQRVGAWGTTLTSARDVATFIAAILWDPAAEPLLEGMRRQSLVANDGFGQQFGTARLRGVQGSKMGWANEATTATASVSWGTTLDETWAVAALTNGSAYHNTVDVRRGIVQRHDATPASAFGHSKSGKKLRGIEDLAPVLGRGSDYPGGDVLFHFRPLD